MPEILKKLTGLLMRLTGDSLEKWFTKIMVLTANNKWSILKCSRCSHALGFTNLSAVIYGGTYIEQPRMNLLCSKCGCVKVFHSETATKIIRFLTDSDIRQITESGLDTNNLFFKAQ